MRISQKKYEEKKKIKNKKKGKRENEKHEMLVLKSDYSCVEHIIWFVCGEIFWGRVPKKILVEIIKAYKWWCNLFLRRTIDSVLRKKTAVPYRIGKDPDQSYIDHCWRASTLKSHGDIKIASSWSSWWYMTSDLLLLCMLMLFDCNHQGISWALYSSSLV